MDNQDYGSQIATEAGGLGTAIGSQSAKASPIGSGSSDMYGIGAGLTAAEKVAEHYLPQSPAEIAAQKEADKAAQLALAQQKEADKAATDLAKTGAPAAMEAQKSAQNMLEVISAAAAGGFAGGIAGSAIPVIGTALGAVGGMLTGAGIAARSVGWW